MKKHVIAFLAASLLLFSAVAESRGNSQIGYLRNNHALFVADFVETAPHSLEWHINGSKKGIDRLAAHVQFMKQKLMRGRVIRAWDKFFVLDAAVFPYYSTEMTRLGPQTLQITKQASHACAYEVIRAHAIVVKVEFFGEGMLGRDHSAIADAIIAMPACDDYREEIERFIDWYWMPDARW